MNESAVGPAAPPPRPASASSSGSAGQMLRRAREAQGLPIDALAASIKVTVRKLELLEADRFDELPDTAFTRALAQTVCRSLKIDAAPVLGMLPAATGYRIEQVSEGLNAPFRDRSPRLDGIAWGPLVKATLAPVLILLLAALVYFLPEGSLQSGAASIGELWRKLSPPTAVIESIALPPAATDAAAPTEAAASEPVVETVFSTPPPESMASAALSAAPLTSAGPLQLRASSESWVEVKDARDRVLLSRTLQPGEAVSLDGTMPIRLKIGNAAATEVRFRGEPIDLGPMTSENIARMELK